MKLVDKIIGFINLPYQIYEMCKDISKLLSIYNEILVVNKDIRTSINYIGESVLLSTKTLQKSVNDISNNVNDCKKSIEKLVEKKDPKNIKEQVDRLESCLKSVSSYVVKVNDQYFTLQSTLSTVNRIEEQLEKFIELGKRKKTSKKEKGEQ